MIVASERNVDVWEERIKRLLGLTLAGVTHRLVANAEAVRRYLISRGLDPRRVITIRNGVDLRRFESPIDVDGIRASLGVKPDDVMAIIVARLEPQKGHDTVLDAATQLRDRFPQLRFVIVGGGSRAADLPAIAEKKGIGDRMIFTGFRTDSADLIRASDLSILVSTREGLSNTLLESLAAAKPVVASTVGGNAEVVSSEVGILVPPGDSVALAEAIGQILSDRSAAARMGIRGREFVRSEFSVARMVNETAALYDALENATALSEPAAYNVAS